VDDVVDVAIADPSKAAGPTRVVQWRTILGNVRDPIFKLDKDVRAVVDANSIAGAEVLINPNSHNIIER
jgi:hypothetical protein